MFGSIWKFEQSSNSVRFSPLHPYHVVSFPHYVMQNKSTNHFFINIIKIKAGLWGSLMSTCLWSLVFTTTSTMVFSFFHKSNPVAPTLHKMEDLWFRHHLQISTKRSFYFYLFFSFSTNTFLQIDVGLFSAFPFHRWQCKFQEPMRFWGFVELDPTLIVMGPHFCKEICAWQKMMHIGENFFLLLYPIC